MMKPAREIPELPTVTLWYSPSCPKSQRAIALLERCQVEVRLFDVEASPPTREQLDALLVKLGDNVAAITRSEQDVYTALSLASVGEEELRNALCQHPQLIQRPIGETKTRAMVALPPEMVPQLLFAIPTDRGEMMDLLRAGLQGKLVPDDD